MSNQNKIVILTCPHDGYEFKVDLSEQAQEEAEVVCLCPNCAATITIRLGDLEHVLKVEGTDADEVKEVSESILEKIELSKTSNTIRNPWISGSFYLTAIVTIIVLLLVVARMVNVAVLPIVIVGGLLAVSLVGGFQLRQDKNLSEKNFISLMALTFKQLPFIRKTEETKSESDD